MISFRDIDKKSEEEKLRLVWFLTMTFMAVVLCFFVANATANLAKLGRSGLDLPQLPALSEVAGPDLTEALQSGKDAMEEYNSATAIDWAKLGDGYIAENGLLPDDGFSTLKPKDPRAEGNDVVLEYEHYYKDVPVLESGLVLAVDVESQGVSVREDRLKRDIDVTIDPQISAKDAAGKAEASLASTGYIFKESRLAIVEIDGSFYPVWKTIFALDGEEDKTVLVGALHGNIIAAEDMGEDQTRNITQ